MGGAGLLVEMILGLEYMNRDTVFGEEQGEKQAGGAGPNDDDLSIESAYPERDGTSTHLVKRTTHFDTHYEMTIVRVSSS